ncbi:NAD-dependent epimerase/dehydratase family protein [Thalassolituus sp.]|jgi:NAD(P)-dependent dehydrogenase (short-subunit alcohol dehydrogenase family)|uniref:NAD-dependent epimerase/dehydratase family protein n=1 Tax=Thalassolituus sp. TaxID=2030822 RepID=UPI002A7F7951|nr:NAD-dependent epimerase/dehydratase family protein [Thalassolituus sp.]
MKQAVIITGANGEIGSALCEAFTHSDVVVIGIDASQYIHMLEYYLQLDLNN